VHSQSVARGSVVPLATLLLLALIIAGPLWGPGLLNTRGGGDSPFLLLRTHQLATNLRAGVFPARWMPDVAYGFGYPFFNYYAALPYYLAAGFTLIGLDILNAIKLTQTLLFAVAALGMYSWAHRALRSRVGGWLAAVAYTLAPFHLVNVYVRGDSLSEFAAFAFYPLILWGLDHLAARPSLRRTISPALAYAGLILTHNISALIFSPFALLYLMILAQRDKSRRRRVFAFGTWALGFGILLSAWYWLPALGETSYAQLTTQTTGYFFYGNHFRRVDLLQPKPIYDYYTITPNEPTAFAAMGSVQAALALAGALVVIARWVRQRGHPHSSAARTKVGVRAFALASLILTTWLITPLSRPLWDHVPLLPMVQFPWRFLSVQALFAALLTGALPSLASPPMKGREGGQQWIISAVLALLLAVAGLAGLRPEYLPITAGEVAVEQLQLYELFTGNIGSTIRYEYLPRWVVPRPYTGPALFDPNAPPLAIPLSGQLVSAEEITHKPTRRVWEVEVSDDGAEVAFPLYYWPGWRATVDGEPATMKPAPDSGYLTLEIPAGRHVVAMWLGRTSPRTAAEDISAAAALALVVVIVSRCRTLELQSAFCNPQSAIRSFVISHWPLVICYASFTIALILLVALGPRVAPADVADLTMDFGQMPYLHHNPGGIDLDGWRVTSYYYNTDRLAPGDTLHVTLDWEVEREGVNATLRLVPPAAVRRSELSAIAEATASAIPETDSTSLELPIPHDLGPGLYLIRLEDADEKAEPVYLRPIWVNVEEAADGQPTSEVFADDTLRLHAVEATQNVSDHLDLRLDWSTARPVVANYGLSLRLTDPTSNEWTRLDTQPGYGFLPTSLWPANRLMHDRYTLRLPEGIPPGDDYTLAVILYRVATGESVGETAIPISLDRITVRPDAPTIAHLGDELALSQLKAPEGVKQGETLGLTAYWLAVAQPSADYVAEWRLETAEQVISATLPLAPGSLPTAWPAGAWIAGRAALPIPPTTTPGEYTLSLTLRDPASDAALGTYTLPRPVHVQGRERVWELPAMQREMGARFGDMIELAGYDLEQEETALRLTLHWRALAVPDRHYMLFIHLADPTTGQPVAQVDTMPRGFTYPTGIWAPGEVVSDEVRLSLEGVPTGRYDLAIGWYDHETNLRLPATDRAGNPLPDDRLILPDGVTLP
jgi:hypothetical protein